MRHAVSPHRSRREPSCWSTTRISSAKARRSVLVELGYTVIPVASGAEALTELRNDAGIDILVTDYLMPQMNGAQLSAEARKLKPDLPILLITGYLNIDQGPGADLARLAKPFRHADLANHVHELVHTG